MALQKFQWPVCTWRAPLYICLCICLFVAAEILQANDNLTQVINLYKQIVKGETINGETVGGALQGEEAGE